MNVFTVIVTALGLYALTHHYKHAIIIAVAATLFGTTAGLALPGGQTVLVGHFFLMFFILRAVLRYGPTAYVPVITPPQPGFFLLLLLIYGYISVFLLMPFFVGRVTVFGLMQFGEIVLYRLQPLARSGSNINQLVYLTGNVLAFYTAVILFRAPGSYRYLGKAMLLVTVLNALMAIIDLVTWKTGTADLLDFMKNVNYSFLDDNVVGGLKRISGSFTEASAFAAFTLRVFAACMTFWLTGFYPRLSGFLAFVSLCLLIFSTSSTAYMGIGVAFAITTLPLWYSSVRNGRVPAGAGTLISLSVAIILAFLLLAAAIPGVFDPVFGMIDTMLFHKLDSDSGVERGAWNAQSWQIFFDTYGLGAGVGSSRSSSFAMAILSNVGFIGTGLYLAFFLLSMCAKFRPEIPGDERNIVRACRHGVLAALYAQLLTAGTMDFGLLDSMLLGASASVTMPRLVLRRKRRTELVASRFSDMSGGVRGMSE